MGDGAPRRTRRAGTAPPGYAERIARAARIALVSHSPWLGGAERCLLELAGLLARADGREVVAVLPGDGPLRERLEAAGVPVLRAPARWWARDPDRPWRAPDLAGAARTARVLRGRRPDLVVSSTVVAPAGALAAAALGIPHLWWVQEFGDRDHGYRFALGRRASLGLVGLLSRAVLVPSRAVQAAIAPAVPRARVDVLRYAVQVPEAPLPAAGPPGAPPRLAVLGRIRPSKGQGDAVRALARLRRRDVILDLVGDGTERDVAALRALALRLGVADRVRLRGGRPDPVPWLDRADVVVVPSRDEAFGRVAVEAMKRGRAVVGAARAGTAELVRDGETGRAYAPGDVAGLAGVLDALLADDGERARLARAGWAWARAAFTPDAHLAAFLAHADAAAGPRAPGGMPGAPGRVRRARTGVRRAAPRATVRS